MPIPHRPFPLALLPLAFALAAPASLAACDDDDSRFTARLDNDVWGGVHQDQGYTAGASLRWVSGSGDLAEDACLAAPARFAGRSLPWLVGEGGTGNVVLALDQWIFTPVDKNRSDLILDD